MRETIFNIGEIEKNETQTLNLGDSTVLVLVSEDDYSTAEKETLSKLIKAVRLNEDSDVHILTLDHSPISLNLVLAGSKIDKILIFGFLPKDIGLNIDVGRYQIARLESLQLIFSDSIKEMSTKNDLKLNLWNSLKALFGI